MARKKTWAKFLSVFALVGALNWGLVGLFNFNLVQEILGVGTITDITYTIVGVGGAIGLWNLFMKK